MEPMELPLDPPATPLWGHPLLVFGTKCMGNNYLSCSASDNIWTIIDKTESVYLQKFQCSISSTLSSGEFPKFLANKREAACSYFASGFLDQSVYYRYPTFQASDSYHFVLVSFPDRIFRARWKKGSGELPLSLKCTGMLAHCSFLRLHSLAKWTLIGQP